MAETRLGRGGCRGASLTLLEGVIVLAVILLLAAVLLPVLRHGRRRAEELTCIGNLRSLSVALQLYHNEWHAFPRGDLEGALESFADAGVQLYHCPATGEWYEASYVARDVTRNEPYLIGCPYHRVVNFSPGGSTRTYETGTVLLDGAPVSVGTELEAGALQFADGSRARVSGRVRIVASFRVGEAQWYTILRVLDQADPAEVDAEVTPGSRFEIVTPAVIAGVAGTDFSVEVEREPDGGNRTRVAVRAGRVAVTGRAGTPAWETTTVEHGASVVRAAPPQSCRVNPPVRRSTAGALPQQVR